ncbi:hypothetical protein [Ensifer canadensis]
MEDTLYDAVLGAVESIPRAKRKDLAMLQRGGAPRRALAPSTRSGARSPMVTVFVTKV